MCSIVGIQGKFFENDIIELLKTTKNRGPDSTGVFLDNELFLDIDLNEFSSSADRKVAKPYSDKKAFEGEIEFLPYIMRKIDGKEHYYKLMDSRDNHAQYKEVTPLGKKNKYYEYSEFEEIESVIKPSEVSNLEDKETESDGVNP